MRDELTTQCLRPPTYRSTEMGTYHFLPLGSIGPMSHSDRVGVTSRATARNPPLCPRFSIDLVYIRTPGAEHSTTCSCVRFLAYSPLPRSLSVYEVAPKTIPNLSGLLGNRRNKPGWFLELWPCNSDTIFEHLILYLAEYLQTS